MFKLIMNILSQIGDDIKMELKYKKGHNYN